MSQEVAHWRGPPEVLVDLTGACSLAGREPLSDEMVCAVIAIGPDVRVWQWTIDEARFYGLPSMEQLAEAWGVGAYVRAARSLA